MKWYTSESFKWPRLLINHCSQVNSMFCPRNLHSEKKKTKNILVQLFKTNQYTYFQIGFLDNNIFQILIHNLHELAAGSVPRSAQTRVTAEFLTKSKFKRKCTLKSILNTIKITIITTVSIISRSHKWKIKKLFYKLQNHKLQVN